MSQLDIFEQITKIGWTSVSSVRLTLFALKNVGSTNIDVVYILDKHSVGPEPDRFFNAY